MDCGVHIFSKIYSSPWNYSPSGISSQKVSQMGIRLSSRKLKHIIRQKKSCISSHIMKPITYKKRINFAKIFTDVFLNFFFFFFWNFLGHTTCYLDNHFKRNSLALFLCIHKVPSTKCSVRYQTVNCEKQNHKTKK